MTSDDLIVKIQSACGNTQAVRETCLKLLSDYIAGRNTSESYFLDRDRFMYYVQVKLNLARIAEGLDPISLNAASHLYDVITSKRYLEFVQQT